MNFNVRLFNISQHLYAMGEQKESRETGSYKVLKQEKLFFVLFVLQFWAEKETQDGFHSLTWNPFSQK